MAFDPTVSSAIAGVGIRVAERRREVTGMTGITKKVLKVFLSMR